MEKNNSANKKTEDNKPVKKDVSTGPIPISPKNTHFVRIIIDQPLLPLYFAAPYSRITITDLPPASRYLQFIISENDFLFPRIL